MSASPEPLLISALPPLSRLALAYAPEAARGAWLAFFALDARMAGVVRGASEPLVGQIRLAWWRERLAEPASAWPAGEPLLGLLRGWEGAHGRLGSVVDGWEVLLGEAPLGPDAFDQAAAGRAKGAVAVAEKLGLGERAVEVARLAREWALADFAANVSDPRELAVLEDLTRDCRGASLPRALRPVVVLHGLTCRGGSGPRRLLRGLRLGILGR
jgi:15-cis-phytoene synthase